MGNSNQEKVSEVVDQTHPLYGRRFPLLSIITPRRGNGYALVFYQDNITIRLPLSTTNLVFSHPRLSTKLSLQSLNELVSMDGYLTISQVERLLGINKNWISRQIRNGVIQVHRHAKTGTYLFPDDPSTLELLTQLKAGEISQVKFS